MKTSLFLLLACIPLLIFSREIEVKELKTEHRKNPVGIDEIQPRFSWMIESIGRNVMQNAYSLQVALDKKFTRSGIVWETGRIQSDQSLLVKYDGVNLNSSKRYFWRVRVWDNKGRESGWSETAYFETGLMNLMEWKAKWIELPGDSIRYSPSPHFRKEFVIDKNVASARVYVTSHGFYELHINGKKVGDYIFTPGWTSYGKRLQYQVFDVTTQVVKGKNAIGAILGDGWFRGTLMGQNNWGFYGKTLGLLVQLKITFTDGSESLVVTDDTWKGNNNGAIRMSEIYDGESYDARKELTGWDLPGYNAVNWQPVTTKSYSLDNLVASIGVPVRNIQEIKPVRIFRTPKGSLVADMGQNMAGWIRLKVKGEEGTHVTLRHAEMLDKYGEFYTENLRSAKCELNYILKGKGEEIYEPRFTFMGFRYVEVTGFPGELNQDNITGIVIHSDMTPTGRFESSSPLLNQLQKNIQCSMKGNFIDVPTDCPQRNERLGWTGDAQVFCRTAAFNMDVAAFFTKWLRDVSADQRPGGEVPDVIPDVLNKRDASVIKPSAAWGDVAVILPWTMYLVYGDKSLLETQYPGMKSWVEYITRKAGETYIWKDGSKYGDWLFYKPHMNSHREPDGHTDPDFIATAMYAYSARLLSLAAKELGKNQDEQKYFQLFNRIREAFNYEYVTPAGRVGTNSQTSYVLALMFDLLPEGIKANSAQFLVNDIKSRGNHLSTGFVGTSYLCPVLSNYGYTEVAYDLLLQETYPSWLYPVKMGATTIWERWDGQKTDSTFQDPGMNSFNHYAYGAIGDWMYRFCAGIEANSPGYKNLVIQPHPTSKLRYARAEYESSYGTIASGWERKDGEIIIKVSIPANTKAYIILPASEISGITENGRPVSGCDEFTNITTSGGKVVLKTGSGDYTFIMPDLYFRQ